MNFVDFYSQLSSVRYTIHNIAIFLPVVEELINVLIILEVFVDLKLPRRKIYIYVYI